VVNALRRLALSGAITSSRAREALEDFVDLRIVLYPHAPLLARVWELRQNLTAYDAVYVALAEALGIALLTTDSGIRDAPGHHALVELVQSR
jgi:predicted nucleic acid-binding protein